MEEQIKNLAARTIAIEQILPTLATRQDLRDEVAKLATKDDLRLTTDALQLEMATLATRDELRLTTAALRHEMAKLATKDELKAGLEDAKRYALMLNEATRDDIRLLAEHLLAMRSQLDRIEERRN